VFVLLYASFANGSATPIAAGLIDLDLEEWPLMAVIAVIVAIMADRVTNIGRRYATLYRAASDRLLTAQEDERKRLAADLHDGVGQTLTALTLTLDAADAALARTAPQDAAGREGVRRAREMAGIALEDVRGVAFRLRPARLREAGLVAGLRELALSAGRYVEFSADPSLVRPNLLDEDQEVDIYRIVQEALGNATRHAQPDRVRITVQRVDRMLRIEVVDDGVGFDPAIITRRGLGLASMRDRASVLRGTLRVHSRPGKGTVVRLDVPLGLEAAQALQGEPAGLAPAGLPIPR
jgi:signal transduction histidine kinase